MSKSFQELLSDCNDELTLLQRAATGYDRVSVIYQQLISGVRDGDRLKGFPLLTYKAGNGQEIAVDLCKLQQLSPQHIPPMIEGIALLHAWELLSAGTKLCKVSQQLLSRIEEVASPHILNAQQTETVGSDTSPA